MLSSKVGVRLVVEAKHQVLLFSVPSQKITRRFLTPMSAYEKRIESKKLLPDKVQKATTQDLENLYHAIKNYTPSPVKAQTSGGGGLFGRFLKKEQAAPKIELLNETAPKGLYIYGSVGGGKTTLMDMFYDCCVDVGENGINLFQNILTQRLVFPHYRFPKSNVYILIRSCLMCILAFIR